MSNVLRAVDAPEVDNQRKTFTDIRAEAVERLYGQAMTAHYNGQHEIAACTLLQAAAELANDRLFVYAVCGFLSGYDGDTVCDSEDVVALEEIAAEAREWLDECERLVREDSA